MQTGLFFFLFVFKSMVKKRTAFGQLGKNINAHFTSRSLSRSYFPKLSFSPSYQNLLHQGLTRNKENWDVLAERKTEKRLQMVYLRLNQSIVPNTAKVQVGAEANCTRFCEDTRKLHTNDTYQYVTQLPLFSNSISLSFLYYFILFYIFWDNG